MPRATERDSISILDGSTFCVSDRRGDMDAAPDQPDGFFYRDTRHLSRWLLTVDSRPPKILSVGLDHYFAAKFFLAPEGPASSDAHLSLIRTRTVGDGLHEDLTVLNHLGQPVAFELRLEARADFADLFEVKDALAKQGEWYCQVREHELILGYRRDGFVRETAITATAAETEFDEDGIRFRVTVDARSAWSTCIEIVPGGLRTVRPKYRHGELKAKPNMKAELDDWLAGAPTLESDWDALTHVYRRSLVDLAALRFYPEIIPDASLPAAGLPWFMTLFGRDSLITSYQTLPFVPELAETTLRVLAARRGTRIDNFRDEEPGKILHELRFGELTVFGERPHSPYFGSADATPLFLVLLDEYERWTGDGHLARELEPAAREGLRWIDEYGDRDGDGYVEYERRNTQSGLENQCWKDSANSILFADGSPSLLPRATCEIQGYVYDAKIGCARLAREFWDDAALAERLERQAAELKERFNRDFWLPEREFFALALDREKKPVDSLTSNIGHLLWSGIVDDDRADALVRHLLGPALYSGWGVRTMAEGEGGYNPIAYHNGTVWPHDNSLIAAGLARYGYREEAAQIAHAILEAATFFDYRLPEVFAGYARDLTGFPVEYPTASSPQAWAAAAPLLLVWVLLGLEPSDKRPRVDPILPGGITRLRLRGLAQRPAEAGPRDTSSPVVR